VEDPGATVEVVLDVWATCTELKILGGTEYREGVSGPLVTRASSERGGEAVSRELELCGTASEMWARPRPDTTAARPHL
jgi:hypothetical protein